MGLSDTPLRNFVGRHAFWLDNHFHTLDRFVPDRLMHNVCMVFEITVGWGPGTVDWEKQRTPFLRWFYRWYWKGDCPTCCGEGEFPWIEIRQPDGTMKRHEHYTCASCQGSGRDRNLDQV